MVYVRIAREEYHVELFPSSQRHFFLGRGKEVGQLIILCCQDACFLCFLRLFTPAFVQALLPFLLLRST